MTAIREGEKLLVELPSEMRFRCAVKRLAMAINLINGVGLLIMPGCFVFARAIETITVADERLKPPRFMSILGMISCLWGLTCLVTTWGYWRQRSFSRVLGLGLSALALLMVFMPSILRLDAFLSVVQQ